MTKEMNVIDEDNKKLLLSALAPERYDIVVERKCKIENGTLSEFWTIKNSKNKEVFKLKEYRVSYTEHMSLTVDDDIFITNLGVDTWGRTLKKALWDKLGAQKEPEKYKMPQKKISPDNLKLKTFLEKVLQR